MTCSNSGTLTQDLLFREHFANNVQRNLPYLFFVSYGLSGRMLMNYVYSCRNICLSKQVTMEGTAAGWTTLMLDGMNDLRNQSIFTDVTLVAIDGSTISAHSLVLASGSDHFKDVRIHGVIKKTFGIGNRFVAIFRKIKTYLQFNICSVSMY